MMPYYHLDCQLVMIEGRSLTGQTSKRKLHTQWIVLTMCQLGIIFSFWRLTRQTIKEEWGWGLGADIFPNIYENVPAWKNQHKYIQNF